MTVRIEMPQLSAEGESAALASWLVKAGDQVEAGEVVAELETDKSTIELESPVTGTILEILVAEGTEDLEPGTLLAQVDAEGRNAQASGTAPPVTAVPVAAASSIDSAPAAATSEASPRSSTPLARRAAANRGLDLNGVEGSGAGGRIVEADVLRSVGQGDAVDLISASELSSSSGRSAEVQAEQKLRAPSDAEANAGFETKRLSAMRKTIARRMTESKQQVPHFYLSVKCSMDAVMAIRAKLNSELLAAGRETKLSVNDFVVRAAALSLRDVPAANVRFAGDAMHFFDHVDIAVAVATEGGLVTPVVRGADRKGLTVLAEEVKALAVRARAGDLRPEEYQNGTFTISNLGMYGIDTVYPILNPPQACILGVGAAEEQPVVRDGEIVVGRVASITLAADHRAVDGAVGAQLLAAIRARLEDPLAMML